jgi:glycosyltransferase involved in cell wall biosynthesis
MLAACKPVIVSQNGGLAECVEEAGLMFPNGNAKILADQMQTLIENPVLYQSLKEKAQQQILKFDELEMVKEYVKLFERLL